MLVGIAGGTQATNFHRARDFDGGRRLVSDFFLRQLLGANAGLLRGVLSALLGDRLVGWRLGKRLRHGRREFLLRRVLGQRLLCCRRVLRGLLPHALGRLLRCSRGLRRTRGLNLRLDRRGLAAQFGRLLACDRRILRGSRRSD